MSYLVKCPICQKTKKVDSRVKNYFVCDGCRIAIELKPNVLAKSFVLPSKEEKEIIRVRVVPDNEWGQSEGIVKSGNEAIVKESLWKYHQEQKKLKENS